MNKPLTPKDITRAIWGSNARPTRRDQDQQQARRPVGKTGVLGFADPNSPEVRAADAAAAPRPTEATKSKSVVP